MKTIKSLTEAEISELPKLPEGWVWIRLDSAGELFCGQSPSIAEVNQEKRGVPYVTGPEQWDGSKIKETKWTEFPKRLVPEGCIFITVKGAGVGKIFPGVSCAIGRDIYAFLPSSKVDFKYTLHAIKHQIDVLIMKAQGDIPGLSKNHILDHVIGLCSLEEQRAIVFKIEQLFSELDNGIANLKLAQEQLKVYRQAVLKKAFEGELTKKWREQQVDLPDAGELLERIRKEREEVAKDTGKKVKIIKPPTNAELVELPMIPKEWMWVKLDYLGDLGRGKSKHRPRNDKTLFGGKYPFIQTGEVKAANHTIKSFEKTYSDVGLAQSKLWPKGTLCITIAANIAETAFLGFEGCFPDSIVGFTAIESLVGKEYVYYFFKANQSKIESFAPATAQKNINLNILENLLIPLCSLPEQQDIVQEIETRLSVCDKIEQDIETNLEKAEALRQSILKKAFEGKLLNERELEEVRGAEDWEPAEVLLERVKSERARK
ncbi:TPA: restriction endonuclease [Methanosarcina acetivorans]|uniref:Type I site-specific deoxyribonuclease n=2 Tax=Methanosarcina acetivorans TaxID=2214 RepID=Q8TP07_METAC|nr:restriction endonuclease subunit S [Methanosarcina acetivorans]AAM05518.1 type I site-specific deoxyribonuclease [Methanosarcina acetivorans C2A]HIH93665.1 restriction endonuclease [Methanosarcina acetivorans]